MIIVREGRVYGIPGSRIWDSSLIFEKHCGTASDMGRIRRRAKDQHPCRYKPMYPVIHERGRSMKHERFAHTMSAKMLLRLIETIYAFLGHVKKQQNGLFENRPYHVGKDAPAAHRDYLCISGTCKKQQNGLFENRPYHVGKDAPAAQEMHKQNACRYRCSHGTGSIRVEEWAFQ
jgi:hypothetical protein